MRSLVLLLLVACSTPPADSMDTYSFREGATMTVTVDGRLALAIEVRDGRLLCNGVDTGPYRDGAPVQFPNSRELLVDGEARPIPTHRSDAARRE